MDSLRKILSLAIFISIIVIGINGWCDSIERTMGQWIELGDSGSGLGLGASLSGFRLSVECDRSGFPIVAWVYPIDSYTITDIYLLRWNGSAWVEIGGSASGRGISITDRNSSSPCLVLDEDDNPIVAWSETGNVNDPWDVYLRRWNGSAWIELGGSATGGGISDSSDHSFDVHLQLDNNGFPIVVWSESVYGGDGDIYLKKWNGTAWVEIGGSATGGGISNTSGDSYSPCLAIDQSGNIYVAWWDLGESEIYLKKWNGTNWTEIGNSASNGGISNAVNTSSYPSLALSSDGSPFVCWQQKVGGSYEYEIYLRYWDGDTWQELGNSANGGGISDTGGDARISDLVLDNNDCPIVVWRDTSTDNHEIYLRRWDGSSWIEMAGSASGGGISNNSGYSGNPAIVLDNNVNPIVVWYDTTSGDGAAYLRKYESLPAVRVLGDVNGDFLATTTDALLVAQYDGGFRTSDDSVFEDLDAGDVNFDGNETTTDALLIAQYDGGFRGELEREDISFQISSIVPMVAKPGEIITLSGSGFNNYGDLEIRIGTAILPVLSQEDTTVTSVVPWLPADVYEVRLVGSFTRSNSVNIQVEDLSPATMTAQELSNSIGEGAQEIVNTALIHLENIGDIGISDLSAINEELEALNEVLQSVQSDILSLSQDDLQLLENLLNNAGLLEFFNEMVNTKALRSKAAMELKLSTENTRNLVYLQLDTYSFVIGNANAVMGPLAIAVAIASPVCPPCPAISAILFKIKTILGYVKLGIDILPTDLENLDAPDITDTSLSVGETSTVFFTGDFRAQATLEDVIQEGLFEFLTKFVDVRLDRRFRGFRGASQEDIKAIKDGLVGALQSAGIDLTDSVQEAFRLGTILDDIYFSDQDVSIDPNLYQLTPEGLVRLALPGIGDAVSSKLAEFLNKVGIDMNSFSLTNPITFSSQGIATYDYQQNQVVADSPGSTSLSGNLWFFEEKFLGFHWPVDVNSPQSSIITVTGDRGTIYVSSNISEANWTITGPQFYSGSGLFQTYSNAPTGYYTIYWGMFSVIPAHLMNQKFLFQAAQSHFPVTTI